MIELTAQQVEALEHAGATPPRVVNPRTKETFVLVRLDDYERLTEDEYDDSPWTREELQALAWERVKDEDWDEYDRLPELFPAWYSTRSTPTRLPRCLEGCRLPCCKSSTIA